MNGMRETLERYFLWLKENYPDEYAAMLRKARKAKRAKPQSVKQTKITRAAAG